MGPPVVAASDLSIAAVAVFRQMLQQQRLHPNRDTP